jgi:hypothetical protein
VRIMYSFSGAFPLERRAPPRARRPLFAYRLTASYLGANIGLGNLSFNSQYSLFVASKTLILSKERPEILKAQSHKGRVKPETREITPLKTEVALPRAGPYCSRKTWDYLAILQGVGGSDFGAAKPKKARKENLFPQGKRGSGKGEPVWENLACQVSLKGEHLAGVISVKRVNCQGRGAPGSPYLRALKEGFRVAGENHS